MDKSPRFTLSGRPSSATAGEERRDQGLGTLGIQATILSLAHEQERVQKKTFTNWMNTYLCKNEPPKKIDNLFEEIKDGTNLIVLLKVLSGATLLMEKGPRLKRVHHLSNISTALKFLETKQIKLVNINATDIADGKPSIVLGLIWTIILYFQIEETASKMAEQTPSKKMSAMDKFRVSAKKVLLQYATNAISKRYNLVIKDFHQSWRDGIAFNAMIHNIRPELVDIDNIHHLPPRTNLENAFSTAETHLGIPRLIDPEDVDVAKPDEKSIMTYVAQFMKAYPDAGDDPANRKRALAPGDSELKEYSDLMAWIGEAEEVLKIVDEPLQDLQQEYMDYLNFKANYDTNANMVKQLDEKVRSGTVLKITPEQWSSLMARWAPIAANTRAWLVKLDAALPGKLGKLCLWLHEAEDLLDTTVDRGNVNSIQAALQQHQEMFHDLDTYNQLLVQVKRAGRYEGQFIYQPHLDEINRRFAVVHEKAPLRERQLQLDEQRMNLARFVDEIEVKVTQCCDKPGSIEDVETRLEQLKTLERTDKMSQNYDKITNEMKKRLELYKKTKNYDKSVADDVTQFVNDAGERWKRATSQLTTTNADLDATLDLWKRYLGAVEPLSQWIAGGEAVLSGSLAEKQEYFCDLSPWEDKHRAMNDNGQRLIANTEPVTSSEVAGELSAINQRYDDLLGSMKKVHQEEVVDRAKQDYNEGVERIQTWLQNADSLMNAEVPCVHAALKEYLLKLDLMNTDVAHLESDFKLTTKTAQSLVKESSQEDVNGMLETLNQQKEVIVKLRKEIPDKIKHLKAMLPNVESLETGLLDLNNWLDNGEQLLGSNRLDGSPQSADARLDKHKAFFAETTYQKSILESKTKVYQKVLSSKPKLKNVNFDPLEKSMNSTQQRFQSCISASKEWEIKLENLSRLWRIVAQKHRAVDEWVEQAGLVLADREDDVESLIHKHQTFFETSGGEHVWATYGQATADVQQVLDEGDQTELRDSSTQLETRHKAVSTLAPIRLTGLEFSLHEGRFVQQVEAAEKTLTVQQHQLSRNDNVKDVLMKHREMFHKSDFFATAKSHLDSMHACVGAMHKLDADNANLEDRYDDHLRRWRFLQATIDSTHNDLKQLPERWKDYNHKLQEFSTWVSGTECLMADLQNESLTNDEYQDAKAKFQDVIRNVRRYSGERDWLAQNLNELIKDAPEADAERQREQLEAILSRFTALRPELESVGDKSSVFARCYDFKETVDKRGLWLADTQRLVNERPYVDGLQEARALLQDHEQLIARLDREQKSVEADLEVGRQLQTHGDAPAFVGATMDDFGKKWTDTNTLAREKHDKLKKLLSNWEEYEGEKTSLLQQLKSAEAEIDKPAQHAGQELAQKDLQSKKEIQVTLSKLKENLSDMQKLNALLVDGASGDRRGDLQSEVSHIDGKLLSVATRLNAKLSDLESTIARWNEYYKRLNVFSDWLAEKDAKLTEVDQARISPEDKLARASVIAAELYDNNVTLENLEKDARGLSQNFRSRETAALKTKLTSLRRQWESLCSRASDRSSSLTNSVAHWNTFQTALRQLLPWIEGAERQLATSVPRCASLEEAQDVYDGHQAFLRECEQNFPLFEKMSTEAGYILDQPEVSNALDDTQKRWASIISSSEERTHKLDKMHGAWYAYNTERRSFEQAVAKIEMRLNAPAGIHSADMQVLEQEVALSKALQEEIRGNQPQFNALQRQLEQLQGHVSPVGSQNLAESHDALKTKWSEVIKMGAEKQNELAKNLQQRREFYGALQDFEKWSKKMQRKLDTGSEIYSDEVGDVEAKLASMKNECREKDPIIATLKAEYEILIANCNDDEKLVLESRLKKMTASYDKINELIDNRSDLCGQWSGYHGEHTTLQSKLKKLQSQLESSDLKEDEMELVTDELSAVRSKLADLSGQTETWDNLMSSAQMTIKDRASQRTLHFASELQNLETICDQVDYSSQQKQGYLNEISQLHSEFDAKKKQLLERLNSVDDKAAGVSVSQHDIHGVKELVREIEDIQDDLDSQNTDYEQLRDLGRQLIHSDPSKAAEIKECLQQLADKWDASHRQVSSKHHEYRSVVAMWQQYNDTKESVVRVLDEVDPLTAQAETFTNPAEAKRALDKNKSVELDLQTNQNQLDYMNVKGIELLEAVKNIPNFDSLDLVRDLDNTNNQWETLSETMITQRETLEAQLNCWDQFESGAEEVGSWLNNMVTKLEDSLTNFDDSISVETRLHKYKEDMPHMAEILGTVSQTVLDFQSMNKGADVPAMTQQQAQLVEKFDKLGNLATQMEDMLKDFSCEQESLKADIEDEATWLLEAKTRLAALDDLSGSDEDIVTRLQQARTLEAALAPHKQRASELRDKADALHAKYPSAETASLAKDAASLAKKFEALKTRYEKVDETLIRTVEQHCDEARVEERRWLGAAREKTSWCADVSGDQYNVEAKVATIDDLLANMGVGEKKQEVAMNKSDIVKSVLSPGRHGQLDQQRNASLQEWKSLTADMENTKVKLENSLSQWKMYDAKYERLSSCLKDHESDVRSSSSLKPDLANKMEQLERLKQLEKDIIAQRPDFQHIQDEADDIKRLTGDARPVTSTTQLATRYQALVSTVHDTLERAEQNVEDHEQYNKKMGGFHEWLREAHKQLDSCREMASDGESLQRQLSTIQALMDNKDHGLGKFSAALDGGEKLYPNTSNEGREVVRNELRATRDQWEAFIDGLNETQRALNASRMQWTSFDENYEQIHKWVDEVSNQVIGDYPYKDTLQEKKSLAQYYKLHYQDVQSHQSTVDSLTDKGRSLSSTRAKSRLDDLRSQYTKLLNATQECGRMSEDHVLQHEGYHDAHHQCHDFLSTLSHTLSVCAELSTDIHSVQSRIDKTDEIIASLENEPVPVEKVWQLAETVVPQTAEKGTVAIRSDCDNLGKLRTEVCDKTGVIHASLTSTLKQLEKYEAEYERLSRWLRDTEAGMKDLELRARLDDKAAQVAALEDLQTEINGKREEFESFSALTSEINVDNRLTNQSSQLASRYSNVQLSTQELLDKWSEYTAQHRAYETCLYRSLDWVDTMRQRLDVCNNVMGQKADIEDRLAKIQELTAEKESNESVYIQKVVEQGEKLYPSTSSEGRDIIRHELRKLREEWELVSDQMSETQRKLEAILTDWSSHSESHQQVQKWLDDTETSLRDNSELRATLDEKKAQLQAHKVLHRDLLSHQHVLEGITEKAHALSQLTHDDATATVAVRLQAQYQRLCLTSRSTIDQYTAAVQNHVAMNEACHEFTDWLKTSREKLAACSGVNGDKISVLNSIERLKECSEQVQNGEAKMSVMKDTCARVTSQSSQAGKDSVCNNSNALQNQFHDFTHSSQDTRVRLDQELGEWNRFEASFSELSAWLKDVEHRVREHEPVATVEEKQKRLEKFQTLRQEAMDMQPVFDTFTDKAQVLTVSDPRLASKVTQLNNNYHNLLTQLKECVAKSDAMCTEHVLFDTKHREFVDWLSVAEEQLQSCSGPTSDQADVRDKHALVEELQQQKDIGLHKLNEMVEAGERLYPDTAVTGRETLRQILRTSKEDCESLLSGVSEARRTLDGALAQWSSFTEGQDEVLRWLGDVERRVGVDVRLKDTVREKQAVLQACKDLQQDILSHQCLVDSVVEKAQSVSQSTSTSDMPAFITEVSTRYEGIAAKVKNLVEDRLEHVQTHQQFDDCLTAVSEWVKGVRERLSICNDTSGDRYSIQSKLDRITDLVSLQAEGDAKLESCTTLANKTTASTGLAGSNKIRDQLADITAAWRDTVKDMSEARVRLERVQAHWERYEGDHAGLCDWLKAQERVVKDFPLMSTLDEKKHLVHKYQAILELTRAKVEQLLGLKEHMLHNIGGELTGRQTDIDAFCDAAENLRCETGEVRLATQVSQLVTRHHALVTTVKDVLKKCEQNVVDHENYDSKHAASSRWVEEAREKYQVNCELCGSKQETQARLDNLQDLLESRPVGVTFMRHANESGEKLYPNTAPEGRDLVRKCLRSLNTEFEKLFDDLATSQRQLDGGLAKWSSFDESRAHVTAWLDDMERELAVETPLAGSLDEKRSLLHKYKTMHQYTASYQKVIEALVDKGQGMSRLHGGVNVEDFVSDTARRYHNVGATIKEQLQQHMEQVSQHEQYTDAYVACVEWLNTTRERLLVCSDVSGDRLALHARLDKINDIASNKDEGDSRLVTVQSLCATVTDQTATQGRDVIQAETLALSADWEKLISDVYRAKTDLDTSLDQWDLFERDLESCCGGVRGLEERLKQVELVATLNEKKATLDNINRLSDDIATARPQLDELAELAQTLASVSRDSRVIGQSSQLNHKHQTLSVNTKEVQLRWNHYVTDHETFDTSYNSCVDWLTDTNDRHARIIEGGWDPGSIQSRLAEIKKLNEEKDTGLKKFQIAHERAQIVLPNTSVPGRECIRSMMQDLRTRFDELTVRLSDSTSDSETRLSRWNVYKDTTAQVCRWLNDLESQLSAESQLQGTYEEKKLRMERVKMLELTIASQRNSIDAVKERAANLGATSVDGEVAETSEVIARRYDVLVANAEKLHATCEAHVRSHRDYRDAVVEASDWMANVVEQVGSCSDVRGDRVSLESHELKLKGLIEKLDEGRLKLDRVVSTSEEVKPQTSVQGQVNIAEELSVLTQDFSQLKRDIDDLKRVLDGLLKQWDEFDRQYAEMSDWIEKCDLQIKADSVNQSLLEDKSEKLQKQKALHETILSKQSSLDTLTEQAQVLLQSSVDGRIMAQLNQLGSSYNSLVTSSKYCLKRYKQAVKDHQQYRGAYGDARTWIRQSSENLSACCDAVGDKFLTESQLEKLQEFSVTKDEGQLLLQSANTWGDVTMSMTSDSGIDTMRSELDDLQSEWDSLLSRASDDKMNVETKMIRWNDLDANLGQVGRWLSETERKLQAPDTCVHLSDKKTRLESVKSLEHDIDSYQQLIDSVTTKAVSLGADTGATLAPELDAIHEKYARMKTSAHDLLVKSETSVTHHQTYHDATLGLSGWLRAAKDKLTAVSDVHGDKGTIQAKILKAQALLADLPEGSQKLAEVRAAGQTALDDTSPGGQSKLRHEMDAMTEEFDQIRTAVEDNLSKLDTCDEKWRDYGDVCEQFSVWLKGVEDLMSVSTDLMATGEEKKHQTLKYQHYSVEIADKQGTLAAVKDAAQALLSVNPNTNTSQTVIQLSTRYQNILTKCKDTANKLENRYHDHAAYNENVETFGAWLGEENRKLASLNEAGGSKEEVTDRLKLLKELQTEIENGQSRLRILSDVSDRVLPNTSSDGCQVIDQQTNEMRDQYETLRNDARQSKQTMEASLSDWNEFGRLYNQLSDWMAATDAKMSAETAYKSDVSEKKSHLDKIKTMQQDITNQADLLDTLEAQAAKLGDHAALEQIAGIRQHYQSLLDASVENVDKMEDQVNGHEDFRTSYNGSLDWLTDIKKKLRDLNNCSGDQATVETRLKAVQDLRDAMASGEEQVKNTDQLGETLCETTGERGQEVIRRDLEALADDWNRLVAQVEEVETNLESAIGDWDKYQEGVAEMKRWIGATDDGINDLLRPASDLTEKQLRLKEGKALLEEVSMNKPKLDQLRQDIEVVSRKSGDPNVGDSFMQVSSAYQTLLSAAKNMVQILEENCKDHSEYDTSYDACVQWLGDTTERVRQCHDTSGDWHTVAQRVDTIKEITSSMDDGLARVNRCCDLAERILPSTASSGKKDVERRITRLTDDWERLNATIGAATNGLEAAQQTWHDYEEMYGALVRWLNDVEGSLGAMDERGAGALAERKTLLDEHRGILSDIDSHETDLKDLSVKVNELQTLSNNHALSQSHRDLSNRYEQLRFTAQNTCGTLERQYAEHLEYHEAQQACEKWLLQTSFKLMSHNALSVRSLELTERQILAHRDLLREIEDYHPTLQQTVHRGRRLLEIVHHQPDFVQQTQAEILNLEESYQNLQLSGVQIKNRLDETLKKWEEYKTLLEQHQDFLSEDIPQWLNEANANVPDDLNDAIQQLDATKEMKERLLAIKQEITNTAHRCKSLDSSDAGDQSEVGESGVDHLGDDVNTLLENALEQTEERMTGLNGVIEQWEGVDEERSSLCNWLHSKQEDVHELEHTSAKLHPDAAEMQIAKLKMLRNEVQQRGDAINTFVERYNTLTQHNSDLTNPVVQAVREDWEELLGHIDNLITDREHDLQKAREFETRFGETDEELDRLASELDRIDQLDASMEEKGKKLSGARRRQLKSRGTQTRGAQSARSANRGYNVGSDNSDDDTNFGSRNQRGYRRGPGNNKFGGSRSSLRSPSPVGTGRQSKIRHHGSHKSVAAESETDDESGYGETLTAHASSFDTQDEVMSVMSYTPRGATAAASYTGYESDNASTVSYRSDCVIPVDPADCRNVASQTISHTGTQTSSRHQHNVSYDDFRNSLRMIDNLNVEIADLRQQGASCDMVTQTSRDNITQTDEADMYASSNSLSTQTKKKKKKNGIRSELLKNILTEVKGIKAIRGLGTSNASSVTDLDSETMSTTSSVDPNSLRGLLRDVRSIREVESHADISTQTAIEQSTQTSRVLFPEGDTVRIAREARLNDLMGDIQSMRDETVLPGAEARAVESGNLRDRKPVKQQTFQQPPQNVPSPEYTTSSGDDFVPARYAQQAQQPLPHVRRRVRPEDVRAIQERVSHLRDYHVPKKRSTTNENSHGVLPNPLTQSQIKVPPPIPTPVYMLPDGTYIAATSMMPAYVNGAPGYLASQNGAPMWNPMEPGFVLSPFPPATDAKKPKRRAKPKYHVREFRRAYDDMDIPTSENERRRLRQRSESNSDSISGVMNRYHLDMALSEAENTAKQLKKISSQMKRSLNDELRRL